MSAAELDRRSDTGAAHGLLYASPREECNPNESVSAPAVLNPSIAADLKASTAAANAGDGVAAWELRKIDRDPGIIDRADTTRANVAARDVELSAPLGPAEAADLATIAAVPWMDRLGARLLAEIPSTPPPPLLLGRLDPTGHTILFGPGGTGKGVLASSWITGLVKMGKRVLILDYENHPEEWSRRVGALAPSSNCRDGVLWVAPLAAAWSERRGSLWLQADEVRGLATTWGADLIVVDSIVPACGAADSTDPSAASQYTAALSYIGLPTLSLAHVTKVGDPSYPFGSVFWHNLARQTWSAAPAGEGNGHSIALTNRKHNNHAAAGKFMVSITWTDGLPRDVLEQGYSGALADRIDDVLREGDALTVRAICDRLDEDRGEDDPKTKSDSVRAALRRGLSAEPSRYLCLGAGESTTWSRPS